MKKISIIVPMYNASKTFDRCIGSILNQTYKNFELILVNDASTDNTLELAYKCANYDDRVIVIDNPHGGVSKTRNKGLSVATGDYIQFVDADDDIEPNMLEVLLKAALENDADIVSCAFNHPSIVNYAGNQIFDMTNVVDQMRFYQCTFACVVPWNKLFKRTVITNYFDEEVAFNEDDLFCLANMFNAKRAITISDVLYNYYVPPKASIDETSCINNMAKQENFWETKKTFWYMRNNLLPKVLDVVLANVEGDIANDFLYTRSFEFMIWEMLILNQVGVDVEGLITEMTNIFKEEEFKVSVDYRSKYGIKLIDFTDSELDVKVREYVLSCLDMIEMINNNNLDIRPYYVCEALFASMFVCESNEFINTVDSLALTYFETKNNTLKEAKFVFDYLNKKTARKKINFALSRLFA
jgi:glycosyltransferase involved in cell wall biosynthesis